MYKIKAIFQIPYRMSNLHFMNRHELGEINEYK
jgi:hypothetical protein